VQIRSLRRSSEVDAGRPGCCNYLLYWMCRGHLKPDREQQLRSGTPRSTALCFTGRLAEAMTLGLRRACSSGALAYQAFE
jgi:hypothetical protein